MYKRRREGKTDYKARINLLMSGKNRIVIRKTNRYIIVQYVESKEAKDRVLKGVNSKELLKYGWPETKNIKSIPACYLTGFLLGKKILFKEDKAEAILDTGLIRSIKKSKIYAVLKGIVDSGIKIKHSENVFPSEERIRKNKEIEKIKEKIENETK